MTQSDLSPSNCLERKKATGAIFEYATRGYLHLAAVAPSATTALATKEPALRQIPHGLGNTRGTINVKMLLRAIQILSHLEYGPVPSKQAQLPGAEKTTGVPFENATPYYLHLATVAPSATTALATEGPALRQIAYGLGNTRGTMNVKMLLFVIQVLSHLKYGPVPSKPTQLFGAEKITSAILGNATPYYLHLAAVAPLASTALATEDPALR